VDLLFLEAKPIPSHAIAAMLAVILGGIQFLREKGTFGHKALGWTWMLLMLYVSVSSFFISEIQLWGAFSPIHFLSIWTIISIVGAFYFARVGNIARHKLIMQLLYVLALIVTGLFTLFPGRVMHQVLFGAEATLVSNLLALIATPLKA